ncbi:hypothetical protein JCM6882_009118 [Rhodosporidiobolus microsporus]
MLVRLGLLASLTAAAHAALSLSNGKLAIIDSVGAAAVASSSFTSAAPAPLALNGGPYALSPTDSLKLSFTLEDDQGKGVQPQQAAVVWQPVDEAHRGAYGRDVVEWVKVNRKSGKGKWELDLSRAPPSLLSLSSLSPLSLTLLLSTPSPSSAPLSLPLGSFLLPASLALPHPFPPNEDLPRSWLVEKYDTQPGIEWTFRPKEKQIGKVKAAVGTVVVAAPLALFAGLITPLKPLLSLRSPTSSPSLLLFLLSLLALEASFALFWLDLPLISKGATLLQALPVFGGIGALAALVGRGALGEMRRRRVAGEAKGKKVE